jgi:hypothetical protein
MLVVEEAVHKVLRQQELMVLAVREEAAMLEVVAEVQEQLIPEVVVGVVDITLLQVAQAVQVS